MSFAQQAADLMQRGAALRQSIFGQGVKIDYDNAAFQVDGYYSPIGSKKKNEEAGFLNPHDTFVRFSKSVPFTPALGKFIKITDAGVTFNLQIAEFPSHNLSPEWVLGCKAVL